MMKITSAQAPSRRDWMLLAAVGLFVPALLALLRVLVLRGTILGGLGTGFISIAGPIDGIWPHAFYRIMHDLTHPLLLMAYAAAFACLPLYARAALVKGQRSLLLFFGILVVHAAFFFSYFGSVFLPVGDMVSTIK